MPRLSALRPYSMLLLIPLWMIGGVATAMEHRAIGIAAMTVMLALVLDSAIYDNGRYWPFRRTMAIASGLSACLVGVLVLAGYMPV